MSESITQIWDRQPSETPKSWRGFCTYRDMGIGRSLPKTAAALEQKDISSLKSWSARFDWVARANAYDTQLESQRRSALVEASTQEHFRKVEAFRSDNEKLGRALLSTGAQMLDMGQSQLKIMRENKTPLPAREIHSFLRTAAAIAQIGSQLTAESLGIEVLIDSLDIGDGRGDSHFPCSGKRLN